MPAPIPRSPSDQTFVNMAGSSRPTSPNPKGGDPFSHHYNEALRLSPMHLDPGYFDRSPRGSFDPMLPSPIITSELQKGQTKFHMGNPAPLALWSFATVTALLATFNLFLPDQPNSIILPTALMFGGLAQYIAGFLDLFYGGSYTAIIFVSYGAFWAGNGLLMLPSVASSLQAYTSEYDVNRANGIYHFIWAIYTLLHVGMSFKIKNGTFMNTWNLTMVFITILFEGVHYMTNITGLLRFSGVSAYLAALGAYYVGLADLMREQGVRMWVGKYKWSASNK
ncbi:hypothetical protein O0I10_008222 [Lichtheimia ornata]|uniref:GPR1/FUN34/yaaH family-domain-containing protein n=1 Tax=Lichtheimia ornata TaxID=688661 RepID=A0AAD7XX29_9FUNG|nr:uncharacterized protein O0I10_008222 [Lichtheimia ornata]KAJ8656001.1 hypothetical protein O0I10_008222 [Lichtheimia ornata]